MSSASNASLATMALDRIHGAHAAQVLLHDIRQGLAHPDAMLQAVQAAVATGSEAHVEGFARELQKSLERAA